MSTLPSLFCDVHKCNTPLAFLGKLTQTNVNIHWSHWYTCALFDQKIFMVQGSSTLCNLGLALLHSSSDDELILNKYIYYISSILGRER
jgi:hypothetical protein